VKEEEEEKEEEVKEEEEEEEPLDEEENAFVKKMYTSLCNCKAGEGIIGGACDRSSTACSGRTGPFGAVVRMPSRR
jgi:hypothetical protein